MAQVLHGDVTSSSGSGSDDGGCCGEEQHQAKGPVSAQPAYVRNGFIRKVYSLLTMQLILTAVIVYPFVTYGTAKWVHAHMALYYASLFGCLALMLGVGCCCQSVARKFPLNYIFLLLVTVSMSVMVGFVCVFYTVTSVLQALAATALTFFSLTAYACFTKTDFTGCGPYLYAALLGLTSFGFMMMIWSMFAPVPPFMKTIQGLFGVILFSFYIIYDTQMIVGGSHKVQFDVDDYVFAALNLYLDIINMFLYMLELFGDRSS